jgi:hypothetical protein
MTNSYNILIVKPEGRDTLEALDVSRRIILKRKSKKQFMRVRAIYKWLTVDKWRTVAYFTR